MSLRTPHVAWFRKMELPLATSHARTIPAKELSDQAIRLLDELQLEIFL